jgi:hypothetical protein
LRCSTINGLYTVIQPTSTIRRPFNVLSPLLKSASNHPNSLATHLKRLGISPLRLTTYQRNSTQARLEAALRQDHNNPFIVLKLLLNTTSQDPNLLATHPKPLDTSRSRSTTYQRNTTPTRFDAALRRVCSNPFIVLALKLLLNTANKPLGTSYSRSTTYQRNSMQTRYDAALRII